MADASSEAWAEPVGWVTRAVYDNGEREVDSCLGQMFNL
jgi:hypothetical protein